MVCPNTQDPTAHFKEDPNVAKVFALTRTSSWTCEPEHFQFFSSMIQKLTVRYIVTVTVVIQKSIDSKLKYVHSDMSK